MTSTIANILNPEKSHELFLDKKGPFKTGVRIHCPLKSFAVRKTEFCIGCEFYKGIIKRQISGEPDMNDYKMIMKIYGILCGHPIHRSLCHVPED